MAQTRTATPVAGTIALVLIGGAVATGFAAIIAIFGVYDSPILAELRHSTGFYAIVCVAVGFITAIGLMLTRPRGPVAPIIAVISGYVALAVGNRIGFLTYLTFWGPGLPDGDFIIEVLKPDFYGWDLLAPLAAGAVAGLRVAMVAGSTASRRSSGQPFPQPGGYGQPMPGQPHMGQPQMPGQPMPGQPHMGQPMPGQPMPGQPIQPPAPGQPYQQPGPAAPGQGPDPWAPQGGPPPSGGA